MKPTSCTVAAVLVAACCVALADIAAAQRIDLPAKLPELEARVVQDSNDAAAHYNVALGYWRAKRWAAADSALRRAIALDPQFAAAYMALAGMPYAERPLLYEEEYERRVPQAWAPRIRESDSRYRQAMLLDPLVDVRLAYVVPPSQGPMRASLAVMFGDWLSDYFDGVRYYFEAKYEDSWQRLQRVFNELDAGSGRKTHRLWNTLLFWHGLASAQTKRWDDALGDFSELLERYQDREAQLRDSTLHVPLRTNEFRYILAVFHQRAGRLVEAEALFLGALQEDIGLFAAHSRLAEIAETRGHYDDAVRERRAAIAANPDDPTLLLDVGVSLARAGRLGEAEAALRDAADAHPRDARPLYFLGNVRTRLGMTAEARDAFTRFLAIAPSRYQRQIDDARRRIATP